MESLPQTQTHLPAKICLFVVSIWLAACQPAPAPSCVALEPVSPALEQLEVVNTDWSSIVAEVEQVDWAWQTWSEMTAMYGSSQPQRGWLQILVVPPEGRAQVLTERVNPILISSQETVRGFYLVRSVWDQPHILRLVPLLNGRPLEVVESDGTVQAYIDVGEIAPQTDAAVAFSLAGLADGFYQLTFMLIADPDSTSEDWQFRKLQQLSFEAYTYELWVGHETRPPGVLSFESVAIGQAAASRYGGSDLVASTAPDDNTALIRLTMAPGERRCLGLRLYGEPSEATAAYQEPMPVLITTFWDDRATHTARLDLPYAAGINPGLPVEIVAPSEPGSYQLLVSVVQFAGYGQFDETGQTRTSFVPGATLTSRVLVEVVP